MRKVFIHSILIICLVFIAEVLSAQCPMCRMGVESNLKNGGQTGAGLNTGILFLLSMPYLIVGTIGYIWWKHRKKADDLELENAMEDLK